MKKKDEEKVSGLPENAYRELKEGEVYKPILSPDKQYREVTPWSVFWGLVMAVLFSAAAAFLGLKVGQVFEAAIPIAIIAVGLSSGFKRKNALGENVIIQSIGANSGVIVAGAVVGYFSNLYADNPPVFVVVEAEAAACLYKGAAAGDGQIRIVDGDMETIMAGLACGEPNTISWDILKNHVKVFIAAPDWVAATGMRMLGAPIKGDAPVTSGESGAAPFGALAAVMSMDEYADLRKDIGLDENSRVLLFSTEGDTDPDRYKNIVWKGLDK